MKCRMCRDHCFWGLNSWSSQSSAGASSAWEPQAHTLDMTLSQRPVTAGLVLSIGWLLACFRRALKLHVLKVLGPDCNLTCAGNVDLWRINRGFASPSQAKASALQLQDDSSRPSECLTDSVSCLPCGSRGSAVRDLQL